MKGICFIDGENTYTTLGIFIIKGSYDNLVAFPPAKESDDKNDWPEEDGIEIDLSSLTLNTYELSIDFACKDDLGFSGLVAILSDMGYHDFYFPILDRTYRLRLSSTLQSLLCCNELAKATPKHDMPDVTWYPETEFCYMKNKNGMFVAAKGGFNNESHNHNDVGTFSLYVNTIPVIIDAGVGTYTKQTFGKDRYTIWTMQSNYHNLPMINGVPQKFGQEYKATNTVCNEKKRMFSTDIATAYPAEAKVKSWVRSYALDDKKLIIGDIYTLDEAIAPNQMNFLTWGNVTFPSAGKIRIEVKGQKVEMNYPSQFKAELETIKLS